MARHVKLLAQLEGILLDPVYTTASDSPELIDSITQKRFKDEGSRYCFDSTPAERRLLFAYHPPPLIQKRQHAESINWSVDSALFWHMKEAQMSLRCSLSISGDFFGLVLGFIHMALMRMSPVWPVKWLARMYISIFRGTPLIAQLFMIYYTACRSSALELDPIQRR